MVRWFAARTTPSGLVIPDLSWTAARFGLVPVRDGWLRNGTAAYLTASEYLAPFELAHGRDFDPSAWVNVLLRLHPGELYVQVLASLNRAARFRDPVLEYQQRFLRRLGPGLRIVVASVLAGGVDGQPRWFLARQLTLRAMRMVLAGPDPAPEPNQRIAGMLADIDPETAAMMLVHLAADALHRQRHEGEALFGGTTESLAIEIACNQIFNEPPTSAAWSAAPGRCGTATPPACSEPSSISPLSACSRTRPGLSLPNCSPWALPAGR